MENEYNDLVLLMSRLQEGFSLRDFLIDMQNYYLEAAEDGVLFMSGEDSLKDVEQMHVDLGGAFCNFSKIVRSITLSLVSGSDIETLKKKLNELSVVKCIKEEDVMGENGYKLQVCFV